MTSTTKPVPDVPLPAGAVFGDDWEDTGPEQVVTGSRRGITDSEVSVRTSAVQRADGRIDSESVPPGVHIEGVAHAPE
jgi:hypothetical protein